MGCQREVSDYTVSEICEPAKTTYRAWLQYADNIKKVEQTNLRLVIDSANAPVSRDKELYSSVMTVWKRAMKVMNDLILGCPQRIHNGDIMLGLLSWHLYPDMTVLGVGTRTYRVPQQDQLIAPGGMITVGMGGREGIPDDAIYWSLPLAHMRFYGNAINAERRIGLRESQIPFVDFRYVVLGSVLSSWGLEKDGLDIALQWIVLLGDAIANEPPGYVVRRNSHSLDWLVSLAECCKNFRNATEPDKKHGKALIMFGIRRCPKFLADHSVHPLPLFDLTDMEFLLDNVSFPTNDMIERRIDFLRWWAHNTSDSSSLQGSIIRYRPEREVNDETNYMKTKFHCTSVFITSMQIGHKRRRIENFTFGNRGHLSWSADTKFESLEDAIAFDYLGSAAANGTSLDPSMLRTVPGLRDHGTIKLPSGPRMEEKEYEFVCGDETKAALYRPIKPGTRQLSRNAMTLAELLQLQKKGLVKLPRLIQKLRSRADRDNDYFKSLEALYSVEEIYQGLPGACVDLRVTSQPIPQSHWSVLFREPAISLATPIARTFSAVAFFETGEIELKPQQLEGVMALSHNNSIFVASQMLEDPVGNRSKHLIKKLTGNIGRPGFALLIPPHDPRMQEYDFNKYVVEYEPFDGALLDSFSATSLHLSLTGYELPLDVEPRGNRDSEAYFVETNVSVYNGGEWVGDIDIMNAQKNWPLYKTCNHDAEQRKQRNHIPSDMQAVDSWKAFLDAPVGVGVFRAFENPMARLAAATLATQKGYAFHILAPNGCWACVQYDVFPRQPRYVGSQREYQEHTHRPHTVSEEVGNIDAHDEAEEIASDASSTSGFTASDGEDSGSQFRGLYGADIGDAFADADSQKLFPELDSTLEPIEEPNKPVCTEFLVDVMFIC
jgi:hypothetical protein